MVLPGPPRELQPIWSKAIQTAPVQDAIAGRTTYRQETIRIFGLPESSLADTLRDAEAAIPGFDLVEITTCSRRGEIEMVTALNRTPRKCTRNWHGYCATGTATRSIRKTVRPWTSWSQNC